MPTLLSSVLLGLGALAAFLTVGSSAAEAAPSRQIGESLVLVAETPGKLFNRGLEKGSVAVRSTYKPDAPNSIKYVEGQDYVVDYPLGQVRRTANSRIPDWSKNSLYGQKDFDHNKFPGFGNYKDFVYIDYAYTIPAAKWPVQERQAGLLPKLRVKLLKGEPVTICAFGDSITAGGDATSPDLIYWERWVEALRKRYPKAKITAINSATGGDTTIQGLERLEEKVLTKKPDLVLVAFGMNDQNVGFVPEEKFEANLGSIVDRIRRSTSAEILLLSSILPNPNWHWTSGQMEEYGAITGRVAKAKNCAFADVLTNWKIIADRKKPEDMLSNNVNHPNDFGHWIYFEVLERLGL